MFPQLSETNPSTSLSAIEDFERERGLSLPSLYKEFLLASNGGRPEAPVFPIEGMPLNPFGSIQFFFGINNRRWPVYDLAKTNDFYAGGRIPAGIVFIAGTGMGDYVCLDLRNGTFFDVLARRPKVKTKALLKSLDKRLVLGTLARFLLVPRGGPWPLEAARGDRARADGSEDANRENVHYHYDLSNAFYALFLDPEMVYTCAYFTDWNNDLATAQRDKLDITCRKLRLQSGEKFLDIGCGWGALIVRAAKQYGARATGVTLSRNQYEFASKWIRDEGLEGRCEVRLQDYRDVPGEAVFDKIASVGMFEHVGLRHLKAYFAKIRSLLAEGGLVLNHGITATDPDSRWVGMGAGEFVNRYVFPQGELPHLSVVLRETASAGLEVADVESLRRHYARTCLEWARRLEQSREQAIAAAGDKRYRIWQVYLAGCAHGFEHEWMNIYQVLARKEGRASNPLPLTRDYMYRSE